MRARGFGFVSRLPGGPGSPGLPLVGLDADRTNAGESLRDKGSSAPYPVPEVRSRSPKSRGEAPKGAPAPLGRRSRDFTVFGTGPTARRAKGAAIRTGASRRFTPLDLFPSGSAMTAAGRRKQPRSDDACVQED